MANNYVITSIAHQGDNATVNGTVQIGGVGTPIAVSVSCNWSAITQQPSTAALQAFLAPLMLAAAQPAQPAVFNGDNSSWSQ